MSADLSSLTPVADHLWQTTIFVGVIWLVTLGLKRNRAAVRYWLWFVASAKFLVPFSALIALGSRLSWRTAAPIAQPQWSFVVDTAIQPFAASTAPTQVVSPHASFTLAQIIISVWLCGVVVGIAFWLKCWMQMRRIRKSSTPLPLGLPIPALSSSSQIEPGVFGIFRPVLLLPEGIESRLTSAQLDAVVAHEMAHVRRRDNLTAAIHMVVETVFWFFPLVWWLRARLIEERENACDEAVISMGSEAESYAEGIIEVCKSYAESPAACISGISGSDLKRRIVRILNRHLGDNLTRSRKVALTLATVAVLVAPLVIGALNAPLLHAQSADARTSGPRPADKRSDQASLPSFEIASIKPDRSAQPISRISLPSGRFTASSATAGFLVMFAYNVKPFQIAGMPKWTQSRIFDVDAKENSETADKLANMLPQERLDQVRLMVQSLLADRFKLRIHRTTTQAPMFSLVVADPRKLHETQGCGSARPQHPSMVQAGQWPAPACMALNYPGHIAGLDMSISTLITDLSIATGRTVSDKTGLTSDYDIVLNWTPEHVGASPPGTSFPQPDPSGPTLNEALQDQLGLKLASTTGPVETITVDHIEEPSPN